MKLASVLAATAVATTACASLKERQAAATAEQTKIESEATVDGARKRADYVKCVLDDAGAAAMDPASDAVAPGALADASLAKCGSVLRGLQEDLSMEMFSDGQDVVGAASTATRTADTVRSTAHGKAVALIVDARRKRTATPVAGS